MIALLAGAAALYGALVGAMYVFQRDLLFHPDVSRPDVAQAALTVAGLTEIEFATDDGLRLRSWFLPAPPGRPTILYFHGNGGHIGYRTDRAQVLGQAGYGVLLAGYRGYGGNPGSPSEDGFHRDAESALAYLAGKGVPPGRIALYGESLGSAVAVRLAAATAAREAAVAAVVLEAPFTSIAEVAQHHYPYVPARHLVKDRFDAAARIAAIGAPLLVLHGERDRVVPFTFGRALFAAAVEPKRGWFVPQRDHHDIFDAEAFRVVDAFLAENTR